LLSGDLLKVNNNSVGIALYQKKQTMKKYILIQENENTEGGNIGVVEIDCSYENMVFKCSNIDKVNKNIEEALMGHFDEEVKIKKLSVQDVREIVLSCQNEYITIIVGEGHQPEILLSQTWLYQ
jgi:hypothetical protein